jgi:hypothetical protein
MQVFGTYVNKGTFQVICRKSKVARSLLVEMCKDALCGLICNRLNLLMNTTENFLFYVLVCVVLVPFRVEMLNLHHAWSPSGLCTCADLCISDCLHRFKPLLFFFCLH